MTDAEDAHNAQLNELIAHCRHETVGWYEGQIRCGHCPARFAVVMFPRRAKAWSIDVDEFDEGGRTER